MNKQDLDLLLHQILRNWNSENSGLLFQGLDFFELTQFFLWDKVGRAIRKVHGTYEPTWEEPAVTQDELPLKTKLRKSKLVTEWQPESNQTQPTIFAPLKPSILFPILNNIRETNRFTIVENQFEWLTYWKASYRTLMPKENRFVQDLVSSIRDGIIRYGYQLDERDTNNLLREVKMVVGILPKVRTEFDKVNPDLLFIHTDNHPPYQVYCFEAQRRNIPVLMFQHGLDCEHHILENAFADYIAVWGKGRRDRYLQFSELKREIRITGNPNFVMSDRKQDIRADNLLWVTRPHRTEKCYSPYHYPTEAQEIFLSIVEFLNLNEKAELVIRMHPADEEKLLTEVLEKLPVSVKNRITLDREQDYSQQLQNASLVLSEDSTAALEAMLNHKALIHIHFAENAPVLPLSKYNAAFLAGSRTELLDVLNTYAGDFNRLYAAQRSGQELYIQEEVACMGKVAMKNLVEYVDDILTDKAKLNR